MRKALALAGVAGLLVLAACGKKDDATKPSGDSTTTTTTAAAAASSAAPPADALTLGPDGFGKVKLGDTADQVKAAGLEVGPSPGEPDKACPDIFEFGTDQFGYISPTEGVAVIKADQTMHTPEGIKVDSPVADVRKAYPNLATVDGNSGDNTFPVPGNPKAAYSIYIFGDKVVSIRLKLAGTACDAG